MALWAKKIHLKLFPLVFTKLFSSVFHKFLWLAQPFLLKKMYSCMHFPNTLSCRFCSFGSTRSSSSTWKEKSFSTFQQVGLSISKYPGLLHYQYTYLNPSHRRPKRKKERDWEKKRFSFWRIFFCPTVSSFGPSSLTSFSFFHLVIFVVVICTCHVDGCVCEQ